MRTADLTMKERILEGFGLRLATLRKARGLTQEELGEKVGLSQRMVAYYETQGGQPPGPILPDLAIALGVSTDELLGVQPLKEDVSSAAYRLRKRLRKVEDLPPDDQKTVLKIVDALLEKRGVG
jgi:transcriptional regulator with XRE-family HTH domain